MHPTALHLVGSTTGKAPPAASPLNGTTGATPELPADPPTAEFADVFLAGALTVSTEDAVQPGDLENQTLPDPEDIPTAGDVAAQLTPPTKAADVVDPLSFEQIPEDAPDGIQDVGEEKTRNDALIAEELTGLALTGVLTRGSSTAPAESNPAVQQGKPDLNSSPLVTSLPRAQLPNQNTRELAHQRAVPADAQTAAPAIVSVREPQIKTQVTPPPTVAGDGIPTNTPHRHAAPELPLQPPPAPTPQTNTAPPPQTPSLATLQVTKGTAPETGDRATQAQLEPFTLGRSDGPTSVQTSTTPAVQRSDLAGHVARQIADVAHHLPARPVEITLSPEELGRVRLSVSTHDTGIILNIAAERPDTVDLLRRHIGQLGAQFQSLGYESIAFSFSNDGGAQTNDDTEARDTPDAALMEEPDTTPLHIALSTGTSAGVDLRL